MVTGALPGPKTGEWKRTSRLSVWLASALPDCRTTWLTFSACEFCTRFWYAFMPRKKNTRTMTTSAATVSFLEFIGRTF